MRGGLRGSKQEGAGAAQEASGCRHEQRRSIALPCPAGEGQAATGQGEGPDQEGGGPHEPGLDDERQARAHRHEERDLTRGAVERERLQNARQPVPGTALRMSNGAPPVAREPGRQHVVDEHRQRILGARSPPAQRNAELARQRRPAQPEQHDLKQVDEEERAEPAQVGRRQLRLHLPGVDTVDAEQHQGGARSDAGQAHPSAAARQADGGRQVARFRGHWTCAACFCSRCAMGGQMPGFTARGRVLKSARNSSMKRSMPTCGIGCVGTMPGT